jgi:uncharacterized membrane protein
MRTEADSHLLSARVLLAGVWGCACLMILAAPLLMAGSCCAVASMLYVSFSRLCHQIPDRSFILMGYPLAVCHRCFGLYLGFFFGSIINFPFFYRSPSVRRLCVILACIPMVLDILTTHCGLRHSTGVSRFLTGLILGCLISPLLVQGTAECLDKTTRGTAGYGRQPSREVFHE